MFKITYLKHFDSIEKRKGWFGRVKKIKVRSHKPVFNCKLTFGGEKAANVLFNISSLKETELWNEEIDLKKNINFSGPPMSCGDIVVVLDYRTTETKYLECREKDWAVINKPKIIP